MKRQGLHLDQTPPLHVPLRFFLSAPLFGAAAGLLLLWRGGALLSSPWTPGTVALAHLITLGFITMVMLGALYQIVPVLVGSNMPWPALAPYVHGSLCIGVLALAGGLLGHLPPLLWLALVALALAFLPFAAQLAWALARAPGAVTIWSMALAAASLALAATLGLLFAGEYGFAWLTLDRLALTAIHVYLALGGWVGALITGVGYALIPMFYLSTPFPARNAWLVLSCEALALLTGAAVALVTPGPSWHLLPILLALLGAGTFGLTMRRLLRGRRRQIVDTTLRFWRVGMLAAPLALICAALFAVLGDPRWLLGFGVLFLLGFAAAIINGMLYKIVPFLVWLHRFSKLAGRANVPLLKDLIAPQAMAWQWRSYTLMLALALGAALTGWDGLARLAGLALIVTFGHLFIALLGATRFRMDLMSPTPQAASRAVPPDEPAPR